MSAGQLGAGSGGQGANPPPPLPPWMSAGGLAASIIGTVGVVLFTVLLWNEKINTEGYLGLLLLLAVTCAYVAGPNAWTTLRRPARQTPEDTPRAIAFSLLLFFGIALARIIHIPK